MHYVSFKIELDISKPSKNGQFPIVLQAIWGERNKNIRNNRLGISCTELEWNQKENCLKNTVWGQKIKNLLLKDALSKAEDIYSEMPEWDYTEWAKRFAEQEETYTFDQWADELIKEYNNRGQAGAADHYKDSKRALQRYMGKEKIYFEEITDSVLRGLEKSQIERGFVGRRNFVGLKVIIGTAVKRRIIDKELMPFYCGYNPIGYSFAHLSKVQLPKKNKSKWIKRLGKQTFDILNYQSETPICQRNLDLWRFSYYTMGTDLKDIALMKFSDIEDGLWFYNRQKTGEGGLGKPLIKEAMDIVLKYHKPENKYVFNWILDNGKHDANNRVIRNRILCIVQNLRKRYLRISKELKLDGHFSWRSARYTSASNAVNFGGNVKDIQVLMDHSSVTTTERYALYANHKNMMETLELLRPKG